MLQKTNGRETPTLYISHDSNLNEQALAFRAKSREQKVIDVLYRRERPVLEGRAALSAGLMYDKLTFNP